VVPRLVIASGNEGKLHEIGELLAGAGLELAAADPGVPEDADTYAGNAALKAEAVSAATGLPALGDDSGLEVAALDGFPGPRSARIAPTQPERERLVLDRLAGVPRPWRARFVCVVALAVPGRPNLTFSGEREGEVIERRRGGAGFGYDPVFLLPELGITFAELAPAEKHRWSHRGAAVRALLDSGALRSLPTGSPPP
jgi:XTP/dITP diphosphohydrolase